MKYLINNSSRLSFDRFSTQRAVLAFVVNPVVEALIVKHVRYLCVAVKFYQLLIFLELFETNGALVFMVQSKLVAVLLDAIQVVVSTYLGVHTAEIVGFFVTVNISSIPFLTHSSICPVACTCLRPETNSKCCSTEYAKGYNLCD